MKMEIDLNDILGFGEGEAETLQESIQRQVIDGIRSKIEAGIKNKIDNEVAKAITDTIKKQLDLMAPNLIAHLIDAEYTPVDRWGTSLIGDKTTFRKELVKSIHEEMRYKKDPPWQQNYFTETIESVVREMVLKFRESFDKNVNEAFTSECLDYATKKVSQRLGISK